jgi:pyruvate ferredoxin oxidoreductase beta subunit
MLSRLAVQTCYWPLYEVEDGKVRLTFKPKEKKPVTEFLKPQGRFKHLFAPGNEGLLEALQRRVDEEWQRLLEESARAQEVKEEEHA